MELNTESKAYTLIKNVEWKIAILYCQVVLPTSC